MPGLFLRSFYMRHSDDGTRDICAPSILNIQLSVVQSRRRKRKADGAFELLLTALDCHVVWLSRLLMHHGTYLY